MRSRTSSWFETKIRYRKTMEDGMEKPVTEQYVVDALSFSEAASGMSVYGDIVKPAILFFLHLRRRVGFAIIADAEAMEPAEDPGS